MNDTGDRYAALRPAFHTPVIAALSLLPLCKRMQLIVLAYGYLMAVIVFDQTYTVLYYNLEVIRAVDALPAFGSIRLLVFFVYPIGFLWLSAYLMRSPPRSHKILAVLAFIALAALYDYILVWAGCVELPEWSPAHSLIRHLAFLAVLLPAIQRIRVWVRRKEAVL